MTPNAFGVKPNDLTEIVNMIKASDEHQELLEGKNSWCSPLTSRTDSMAGAGIFDGYSGKTSSECLTITNFEPHFEIHEIKSQQ